MLKNKVYFDALSIAGNRMSGIGHVTLETIRALSSNVEFCENHEIFLILPLGKKHHVQTYNLNVSYKVIPLPARVFSLLLRLNLLPPIDILLGRGTYIFPNYRNWPLLKSKSITYIHDLSFIFLPEAVEKNNLRYLTNNVHRWISRSDVIITGSQTTRNEIIDYFPSARKKTQVIQHGVDPIFFKEFLPGKVNSIKKKYGINVESYILIVGNIEPRKNLERIISAHGIMQNNLALKFPLVIIGGGGWSNEKIDSAISEGVLAGTIIRPKMYVDDSDLPGLYLGATALVQVALYEGFGMSPLQALAAGTPVLLSNIEVFKEIFGNKDGVHFVDQVDIKEIKNALMELVSTPVKVNRHKEFTWKITAERLAGVIRLQE